MHVAIGWSGELQQREAEMTIDVFLVGLLAITFIGLCLLIVSQGLLPDDFFDRSKDDDRSPTVADDVSDDLK